MIFKITVDIRFYDYFSNNLAKLETYFELNCYHFNVFGIYLHYLELRIQSEFNFSFGGNSGEGTDHKASISPKLMFKAIEMILKPKRCGSL